MRDVRTWIEIDQNALHRNVDAFLELIPQVTQFIAVIKSNAYGHGLVAIASSLCEHAYFSRRGWFGVDSIVEALRLRKEGIKNPIVVLGATLPARMPEAAVHNIVLTVSSIEGLRALARVHRPVRFHIKIDTGMSRQGFLAEDIPPLLSELRTRGLMPEGIYSHFAAADNQEFSNQQIQAFHRAAAVFEEVGFDPLVRHLSASGGTILHADAHFDAVRVGLGMYGYNPISVSASGNAKATPALKPVLAWKSIVSEVKEISNGSFVGYDLTKRVSRDTRIGVVPIGYWHGFDRGLSGCGNVLAGGVRTPVLGRVSMDMIVVDLTSLPASVSAHAGDEVVLIGSSGKETIDADEIAARIGTTAYEVLTRINPLIRRVVV